MKKLKKFLSILLIVSMVFSTNGAFVLADGVENAIKTEENTVHKNHGDSEIASSVDDTSESLGEKNDLGDDNNSSTVESEESKQPSIVNDDEIQKSSEDNQNNKESVKTESVVESTEASSIDIE